MEEKAQNILKQTTVLFMQYGIKSLTMDDIARHLGMSKKTLYQSFSDKAELVGRGIRNYIDQDIHSLDRIHKESENAIEEMFLIAQKVSENLKQMHPSILFDLEKYYPKAFAQFQEYKYKNVMDSVSRNIEVGIAQGYYRDNINIPIIAGLYVGRIDLIFDNELFPPSRYSPADVYFEAIRYHIRGIASELGMEYLKNKFKTLDKQNPIF